MKRQILSLICVGAILYPSPDHEPSRFRKPTEGLIAKQVDTTEAKTGKAQREPPFLP